MATEAEIREVARELETDPTGINYSAENQTAADQMNDKARGGTANRDIFAGDQVFDLTNRVEWRNLLAQGEALNGGTNTDIAQTRIAQSKAHLWLETTLLNTYGLNIAEANYLETTRYVFGSDSQTEAALLAARPQNLSRAERLRLGDPDATPDPIPGVPYPVPVNKGHIDRARKLIAEQAKA